MDIKKLFVFIFVALIFIFGCSSECPYTIHPNRQIARAPLPGTYAYAMEGWAEGWGVEVLFDHSDIRFEPVGPFYSDVDVIFFPYTNGVRRASVVIWTAVLLEVERNGEWHSVIYAPGDTGTWALAGTPGEVEYWSSHVFLSIAPDGFHNIYDRSVWSGGHMTPGNYRAIVFVGPHTFYLPFEIIAQA